MKKHFKLFLICKPPYNFEHCFKIYLELLIKFQNIYMFLEIFKSVENRNLYNLFKNFCTTITLAFN